MKKSKEVVKPVQPPEPPKKETTFMAKVIQQAKNPQWVYCIAIGKDLGKIPAIIPRRLTGKLEGKLIMLEAISDANGTSYRLVEGQ